MREIIPDRIKNCKNFNKILSKILNKKKAPVKISMIIKMPVEFNKFRIGSQENLQRKKIKGMLMEWEKDQPGQVNSSSSAGTGTSGQGFGGGAVNAAGQRRNFGSCW